MSINSIFFMYKILFFNFIFIFFFNVNAFCQCDTILIKSANSGDTIIYYVRDSFIISKYIEKDYGDYIYAVNSREELADYDTFTVQLNNGAIYYRQGSEVSVLRMDSLGCVSSSPVRIGILGWFICNGNSILYRGILKTPENTIKEMYVFEEYHKKYNKREICNNTRFFFIDTTTLVPVGLFYLTTNGIGEMTLSFNPFRE
jgi:hypothetical protein